MGAPQDLANECEILHSPHKQGMAPLPGSGRGNLHELHCKMTQKTCMLLECSGTILIYWFWGREREPLFSRKVLLTST